MKKYLDLIDQTTPTILAMRDLLKTRPSEVKDFKLTDVIHVHFSRSHLWPIEYGFKIQFYNIIMIWDKWQFNPAILYLDQPYQLNGKEIQIVFSINNFTVYTYYQINKYLDWFKRNNLNFHASLQQVLFKLL